jgi:hypothetical protein
VDLLVRMGSNPIPGAYLLLNLRLSGYSTVDFECVLEVLILDGVLNVFRVCVVQFAWPPYYAGFGDVSRSDMFLFSGLPCFPVCFGMFKVCLYRYIGVCALIVSYDICLKKYLSYTCRTKIQQKPQGEKTNK